MNDPPTALVGFGTGARQSRLRLGMNDPPTALVGFGTGARQSRLRLGMNDPPTALVDSGRARGSPDLGWYERSANCIAGILERNAQPPLCPRRGLPQPMYQARQNLTRTSSD